MNIGANVAHSHSHYFKAFTSKRGRRFVLTAGPPRFNVCSQRLPQKWKEAPALLRPRVRTVVVRVVAAVPSEGGERKPEFFEVALTTEMVSGRARVIYLKGIEIALFNVNGDFYAVDNLCPHEGGPLVAGTIGGRVLTCPWHRWQFDLKTGRSPVNPAIQVQTYPVQIEGERIKIGMVVD